MLSLFACLLAAALLAWGCGTGENGSGEGVAAEVAIDTFLYQPDPIAVEAGTTVTWRNEDRILHTVTAGARDEPSGELHLELDDAGAEGSHTFEEPGTFDYFCAIHDGMDGRVVVE